jgi:hypothetical protein
MAEMYDFQIDTADKAEAWRQIAVAAGALTAGEPDAAANMNCWCRARSWHVPGTVRFALNAILPVLPADRTIDGRRQPLSIRQ